MIKNVCIVGYGAIGPVHADSISKTDTAKFYAVCDNDPERIRRCREKYSVLEYIDFDEMLTDKNIDAVHIVCENQVYLLQSMISNTSIQLIYSHNSLANNIHNAN